MSHDQPKSSWLIWSQPETPPPALASPRLVLLLGHLTHPETQVPIPDPCHPWGSRGFTSFLCLLHSCLLSLTSLSENRAHQYYLSWSINLNIVRQFNHGSSMNLIITSYSTRNRPLSSSLLSAFLVFKAKQPFVDLKALTPACIS
jgi:hypothetical protein